MEHNALQSLRPLDDRFGKLKALICHANKISDFAPVAKLRALKYCESDGRGRLPRVGDGRGVSTDARGTLVLMCSPPTTRATCEAAECQLSSMIQLGL